MKKIIFGLITLGIISLASFSFLPGFAQDKNTSETSSIQTAEGEINWMTWEEAMEASKKTQKKIFVDCYTNWCGWCKRMDATTFKEPKVVELLNAHFYPVKFNAEQREEITWNGNTFKFVEYGRRGVHELAYSLLDGRLGYPSYVYLDENFNRISISPGYKTADALIPEINYVLENHYQKSTFQEFQNKQ